MYEDLLRRLHAREAGNSKARYHAAIGKPVTKPLTLAGEAAAAIEELLARQTEAPKKRR